MLFVVSSNLVSYFSEMSRTVLLIDNNYLSCFPDGTRVGLTVG
ncbi:unnamed protein product [Urochloa humidicola]